MNNDSKKYPQDLTEEQKSFADLTLLQKYDAVLEVLFDESGNSPTFDHTNEVLLKKKKKIHWGEVMDILNTMVGDGYLYSDYKNQSGAQIFLLSFNGKYLKETGGLEKKIDREKAKEVLSKDQLEGSISSVKWTKWNIAIGLLFASITLVFVVSNWSINNRKYHQELDKLRRDSIDKSEKRQSEIELKKQPLEISLSLKDTAKVKVKIVK